MADQRQVQRAKTRAWLHKGGEDDGREILNKSHWRRATVQGCGSFLLAELLLGKEKP